MLRLRGRLSAAAAGESNEPEINMAPLIDMVFILLIFFLVTTSFVREAGVEIQRPQAATAQVKAKRSLTVAVDPKGRIFIQGRRVSLGSVRGLVERFLVEEPRGAVLIAADRRSQTGRVIAVLDQCRLGGAKDVALAARKGGP